MKVKTRYFGEIELDDSKVITFENGLFGFEEYKKYALLYDAEDGESTSIKWLQCVEEEGIALPVMMPTLVKPDYDPVVEDDWLQELGDWNENNISVLVTLTVPSDLKAMTTNMKAPIIINTESMKGAQVVAENPDYEIKFRIYDIINKGKEES